jgi:hypothetical protein
MVSEVSIYQRLTHTKKTKHKSICNACQNSLEKGETYFRYDPKAFRQSVAINLCCYCLEKILNIILKANHE